jgi:hypothetical protein
VGFARKTLNQPLAGLFLSVLVIVAVGLAFSLPVALWGFRPGDPMHLLWARHFSDQLWAGDLYPRWLMDMNSGLGSPTFFFYGCVPYYVTSVFQALVPYRDWGWPAVGLSTSLALVASGVAAHLWLREFADTRAALAGALVYMLLPYHLKVDYLERFAFAEFWAFVWIPLVLLYTHRYARGDRRALAPLAVSYALLVMTHPPSVLIFSAAPLAYAGFLAGPRGGVAACMRVGGALLLGALLGAIYLVPALTMQKEASLAEMQQGFGFYANNFLFTRARPFLPGMSENFVNYFMSVRAAMGVTTAVTAALVFGSLLVTILLTGAARGASARQTDPTRRRLGYFWGVVAAIGLILMTVPSKPVWDALPVLQKVQFPWRFNILLVCAGAALTTLVWCTLGDRVVRWRTGFRDVAKAVWVLVLGILTGLVALLAGQLFDTAKLVNWSRFAERTMPQVLLDRDYREYRPRSVSPAVFTPERVRYLGETLPRAAVIDGVGTVDVVSWRARHIVLEVDAATEVLVRIKQFYFAGWRARSSGSGAQFPVAASEQDSLVTVRLPPGRRTVELSLDATAPERAGRLVSPVSLLVLLGVAWWSRRRAS